MFFKFFNKNSKLFHVSKMKPTTLVPYELVDIGANLTYDFFQHDYDQVLERCRQAGISRIMLTGTSQNNIEAAKKLADKYPGFLYYTAGIHPHDAKTFDDSTLNFLRDHLIKNSNCVAVGECGLDFNRNFSSREDQLSAFCHQVELACELKKPLFVHEREAQTELLEILLKHGDRLPTTVVHCFTGTTDEARKYIENGIYISLTGFLWKDRSSNGVCTALKNGDLPIEKLLIDSDAPFMYPRVNDKKIPAEIRAKITKGAADLLKFSSFNRNEPSSLAATCELIAAFINKDPAEVARVTTANAKKIYGL